MPRSLKSILACAFLVSFLAIGFGAAPVQAKTYLLTATVKSGFETMLTNWTLTYVDLDFDGKFSLNELVPGSFVGASIAFSPAAWNTITAIRKVPFYSAEESPFTDGTWGSWDFSVDYGGGSVALTRNYWTYTQVAVVTLPTSVPLLLLGD